MKQAAGGCIVAKDTHRILLQQRAIDGSFPRNWGFFGGKVEPEENVAQALLRELREEIGKLPNIIKTIPISKFTSTNGKFTYHSFVVLVNEDFTPELNKESDGYCWVNIGKWPKPLHPGAKIQCNSKDFLKKIKTIYKLNK